MNCVICNKQAYIWSARHEQMFCNDYCLETLMIPEFEAMLIKEETLADVRVFLQKKLSGK